MAINLSRISPAILNTFEMFRDLSDLEKNAVINRIVWRRLRRGETLFTQGDLCTHIFFVCSGDIQMFREDEDDRPRQTLQILDPGNSCACHPGNPDWSCSASAIAVQDSEVLVMRCEDYRYLVNTSSKVALALSKIFAKRLRLFESLIEDIAQKDASQRLVRLLLYLAKNHGIPVKNGVLIPMTLTRDVLASRIGVARETVIRLLYSLKRRNLISLKSRRQIILLDPPSLEKLT